MAFVQKNEKSLDIKIKRIIMNESINVIKGNCFLSAGLKKRKFKENGWAVHFNLIQLWGK